MSFRLTSAKGTLLVLLESSEESQSGQESRQAAANALEQSIKGYIGVSTTVMLSAPGGIERSVGKAKRVIDKREMDKREMGKREMDKRPKG